MNTQVQKRSTGARCRNIVHRLESERHKLDRAARLALHNPTRRKLLKLLCTRRNGLTYGDLMDALNVSERWVRELVRDLRDAGIVETPGSPALIQFTSERIEIVVREVLSFVSSGWIEAIRSESHSLETALSHLDDKHKERYLAVMSKLLRGPRG